MDNKRNVEFTAADLYEKGGWLSIPFIYNLGSWLNVIIGKRQVGKTYGVLREFLRHDTQFLYLRRTAKELELIENNDNLNPFLPLSKEGYNVTLLKNGKYDYCIGDYEINEDGKRQITKVRGAAYNILTMAEMRGFSGDIYSDIVLDEFIPINFIPVRRNEGDAILDIYTTVNGNRELEGKRPCRLWLLANANNLNNPTLESLDLVPIIEKLMRGDAEYYFKNGIFVFMPDSIDISEKRNKTAMMSHLERKGGRYYQMSMQNQFAYNDLHLIKPQKLNGYTPVLAVGAINIYVNDFLVYVCSQKHISMQEYDTKPETLKSLQKEFIELYPVYEKGKIRFENATCMKLFKEYFSIKD